jgi:hypothetical protein
MKVRGLTIHNGTNPALLLTARVMMMDFITVLAAVHSIAANADLTAIFSI